MVIDFSEVKVINSFRKIALTENAVDEKCENVEVMFYTWMKLFVAILKFALVYTTLKIIIFFVMVN